MNKKGVEFTFTTIAVAVLVFIVLVVLIMTFTNLFGKQREWLSDKITNIDKIPEEFEENSGFIIPFMYISLIGFFGMTAAIFTKNLINKAAT